MDFSFDDIYILFLDSFRSFIVVCVCHRHLVVIWPSCLNYLLVEQAVVRSAAAIHKSEISSMDFNPNVKFQVGWDNTQYITKLFHHQDQSIFDPRKYA